jgi:hypothetical protein
MHLKIEFFVVVLCLVVNSLLCNPPPPLPIEFIARVNLTKLVPGHGVEHYQVKIYYDKPHQRIRMDMQNNLHHTNNLMFFKTVHFYLHILMIV